MPKKRSLTEKQVLKLSKMYNSEKYTQLELAEYFGVSRALVSFTLSGTRNSGILIPSGNYKTFKVDGARYAIYDDGRIYSVKNRKFLKPSTSTGYAKVSLGPNERKKYIHRLVLTHFVRKPESKEDGCHKNGNSLDNRLKNLRWDTRKGNNKDKITHNTSPDGDKNHNSVIPDTLMSHILFAYKYSEQSRWEFSCSIGESLNLNPHTIYSSLKRKRYNKGVVDKWNK